MNLKHYFRGSVVLIVGLATMAISQPSLSLAGFPFGLFDQTGCCKHCPACDHVCKFDAEMGEAEHAGFEVESKVICIPRVVFPWQKRDDHGSCGRCDGVGCSNCVQNGARTRRVCVLKPKSYTCPECKYSWTAEPRECTGECDNRACDSTGWDGYSITSPIVIDAKVR